MQIFKPKPKKTEAQQKDLDPEPAAKQLPPRIKLDERDYLTICFIVQTVLWLALTPLHHRAIFPV